MRGGGRWGAVAVALTLVVMAAACGGDDDGRDRTTAAATSTPTTAATSTLVPGTHPPGTVWQAEEHRPAFDGLDANGGDLWVWRHTGETVVAHRWDAGSWRTEEVACRGFLPALWAGSAGDDAWLVCDRELVHLDGSDVTRTRFPAAWAITRLEVGAAGAVWGSAGDGSLFVRFDGDPWRRVAPEERWNLPAVYSPFEHTAADATGALWVATPEGLATTDGDGWTIVAVGDPPPAGVSEVVAGPDGAVWALVAGAGDSLRWIRVVGGEVTAFPVDVDGLAVDPACIEAAGVDPAQFDDPAERVAAAARATEAAVAPDGALWTAVSCVGVGRLDPVTGTGTPYGRGDDLPGDVFDEIAVTADRVWVSGPWGLASLGLPGAAGA